MSPLIVGRGAAVLGCLVVLASVLTGCHHTASATHSASTTHSPSPGSVTMTVSARQALLDVPVAVSLRGLPAEARTTVTATAVDRDGTTWTSSAQFLASAAGAISLQQPSLAGSYTGSNPMGLFEFMAPSGKSLTVYFQQPTTGYDVSLVASVAGRRVAATSTHRQAPFEAGLTTRQLRPAADGVYGELFTPANTAARRPAVLLLGGSEGGLSMGFPAELLAAHGYPALSLAYFKEPACRRRSPTSLWSTSPRRWRCSGGNRAWTRSTSWCSEYRAAARPRCCSVRTFRSW